MIFLKNDYSLGAHPDVLDALVDTNMIPANGYGLDEFCASAAIRIKDIIECPNADVHFLMGGTQTNLTAIAAFLRPHESVIAVETGHICVHETGAIEATGHKAHNAPTKDGKLRPEDIDAIMAAHTDEHMVKPRMVYISNTTETGLFYTKMELLQLRSACNKHGLLLYMDGARLAMALTAEGNDVTFADLPKVADAFYIGGTKCGAMFGEALVIVNSSLKTDMRYHIKQRGGMLAKGKLLGVQFNTLFENELYLDLGKHANRMAKLLADGLKERGFEFAAAPATNQIFPIVTKELAAKLEERVMFEYWAPVSDTHVAIRFVTSWGTKEDDIRRFFTLI